MVAVNGCFHGESTDSKEASDKVVRWPEGGGNVDVTAKYAMQSPTRRHTWLMSGHTFQILFVAAYPPSLR